MEYDIGGLPLTLRGKRRPRKPKTVNLHLGGMGMELCSLGLLKCIICQEIFKVYTKEGDVEFCPMCSSSNIECVKDDQG